MYPLIPLQLFNLRKELKKLEAKNDKAGIKQFAEKAKIIARDLVTISSELFNDNEIYGDDFHKMLLGVQNLVEYLNRVYFKDNTIEEETVVMTKTLYDSEVEKKGKLRGELRCKIEDKIEVAKNLLDILDDETIAMKTELPIDVIK